MRTSIRAQFSLVVVLLLFVASGITYAQPPGGGGGGRQGGGSQGQGQQGGPTMPSEKQITEMVSELAEEISLSSEQEESILDLYIVHFDEMEDKMKSGRPEKSEMEIFEEDFENKVKMFLSDEQIELYEKYVKENKTQREQQGQRR